MTTIITRLYPDTATAEAVADALRAEKFRARDFDVVSDAGTHGSVAAHLAAAGVTADNAAAYAPRIEGGAVLVVVRADFNPVGAARLAQSIVDANDPMVIGLTNENVYLRKEMSADKKPNFHVLTDHPRFLSSDMGAGRPQRRLVSEMFGLPLLSSRPRKPSAIAGGAHMSYRLLPIPLLSEHSRKRSVMPGGHLFTRAMGLRMTAPRRGS